MPVVSRPRYDFFVLLVAGLFGGSTADFRFPGETLSRVVSRSVTVIWSELGRCRFFFFFLTFQTRVCILGVLWLWERSVDGEGELHYSFP